jgi:hypothetical protein
MALSAPARHPGDFGISVLTVAKSAGPIWREFSN